MDGHESVTCIHQVHGSNHAGQTSANDADAELDMPRTASEIHFDAFIMASVSSLKYLLGRIHADGRSVSGLLAKVVVELSIVT